jgi:phosphoadenosine phosphosulfate reductase
MEGKALKLIEDALKLKMNSVIAFSGGKDSTVILDLVRRVDPSIPCLFANTGVEYPATVSYCRSIPNLHEVGYIKSFWKCVEEYGWPTTKGKKGVAHDGNKCCIYLKKKPMKEWEKKHDIKLVFLGITMAESRNRMMLLKSRGLMYACASEGVFKCYPIGEWTESDVWDYIRRRNLPYNSIYDTLGCKRCGCIPCTAYLSWKKRLAKENPKMMRIVLRMKEGQTQL